MVEGSRERKETDMDGKRARGMGMNEASIRVADDNSRRIFSTVARETYGD